MQRNGPIRKWWAVLGIIACGLFIAATGDDDRGDIRQLAAPGPQAEMHAKSRLVVQDVQATDELCRSQCTLDFYRQLSGLAAEMNPGQVREALESMRAEHPHMRVLVWSPVGQSLESGVWSGELPAANGESIRAHMKEAKAEAEAGRSYQSPRLGSGADTHFVIGLAKEDGTGTLIGTIHQDLLAQVETHQMRNLRAVEYPEDKHWRIEAVEPETMRRVEVDHPEENEGISHYHKNEVVVRFRIDPTDEQLQQIKREIGSRSVQKLGYTYVFQADGMTAKELMAYFRKWDVRYAEPHFLYMTNDTIPEAAGRFRTYAAFVPNDMLYARYQWNLPQIETAEGWEISQGSGDVVVGVVDTGVDLDHPDLQTHLVEGLNLVSPDRSPMDDVGHGTHVAGVISALVNNTEGVAGMSWHNPVMPIKALDYSGAGSTYTVAQGIIWATDHGAKVINLSLGNYADAEFLHDAIRYAFDRDVLLVAASGNDNTERPGFPAAYPEVFAVAATDSRQQRASFSNYGDYIDVAAPGVTIASTFPHNQYAALSGTSMASPHVAALAALIRSANPRLKNTDVMEIMRRTAIDLGPVGKDKYFGYGLIDVKQALIQARDAGESLAMSSQWLDREAQRIEAKYKQRTAP